MPITPEQRKRAEAFVAATYPGCRYEIDAETGYIYVAHDPDLPGALYVGAVEELDAALTGTLRTKDIDLTPFPLFAEMAGDDVRDYILRHVPNAAHVRLMHGDTILVVSAERYGTLFGTIERIRRNARDAREAAARKRKREERHDDGQRVQCRRAQREAAERARKSTETADALDDVADSLRHLAGLSATLRPRKQPASPADPEIVIGVKPAPLEHVMTDEWAIKQRNLLRFYNGADDMARGLQLAVATLNTISTPDEARKRFALAALTDLCQSLGIPV